MLIYELVVDIIKGIIIYIFMIKKGKIMLSNGYMI